MLEAEFLNAFDAGTHVPACPILQFINDFFCVYLPQNLWVCTLLQKPKLKFKEISGKSTEMPLYRFYLSVGYINCSDILIIVQFY